MEQNFIKEKDIKKIVKWTEATFDSFYGNNIQFDCLRIKRLNLIERTNAKNGYQIDCINELIPRLSLIERTNAKNGYQIDCINGPIPYTNKDDPNSSSIQIYELWNTLLIKKINEGPAYATKFNHPPSKNEIKLALNDLLKEVNINSAITLEEKQQSLLLNIIGDVPINL